MVKAVKYDLVFLLVPVLEALESKGKICFNDLEMPEKLRQCALKWVNGIERVALILHSKMCFCKSILSSKNEERLCRVFDTKKLNDVLYLKYDRNKFLEYLKEKCEELVKKVKELRLLDSSGGIVIYKFILRQIFEINFKNIDRSGILNRF